MKQVYSFLWHLHCEVFPWKFASLLFLVIVRWKPILGVDSERFGQSLSSFAPLSVTYHNMYLAGHVYQRINIDDWLQCLSACANDEECVSYNLDTKLGTCEINNDGITNLGQGCLMEKPLLFSQGLVFHQIKETGYWSPWQPWSPCSTTCGDGEKRRERVCIGSSNGGCRGPELEEMKCTNRDDGDDDDDDGDGDGENNGCSDD